jgi:hypothetical protein
MGKKSPEILEFQKTYGITESEMWEVRPGSWAVKHSAIERIVAARGITFERPAIIEVNTAEKIMVICVFGKMGDRTEWSFGEASPANCKIAYPASIAEKRAKDRVAIKLLNATGAAIYSEEESDDFRQRHSTHDTLPEDIGEVPAEDLINRADGIQVLTVDAQRPIYTELQKEIQTLATVEDCKRWTLTAKSRASRLSDSWRTMLNTDYLKHLRQLEKRDAVEYIERKTG